MRYIQAQKEKFRLCVITPIHNTSLTEIEKKRLKISLKHLKPHQHLFVRPKSHKVFPVSSFSNSKTIFFDDAYFRSRSEYSRMLLNKNFYRKFSKYTHMLILQTDAIIIKDLNKDYLIDYDYIGAPWIPEKKIKIYNSKLFINTKRLPFIRGEKISVGNGGLSLRKISSMIKLMSLIERNYPYLANGDYNEDTVISYLVKAHGFSVPLSKVAQEIFCEQGAIGLNTVPKVNGFHALNRFNPKLESHLLRKQ